ncbi:MAG TPA: potassium/proton antiporter [Candidatus Cottocaccamicrobium excrementipullorum]|nr:potassium/proton antiporter [Candidatus Cottocaccamicrobium excrementipullorum]
MTHLLLLISLVILTCILCNRITTRFGVPMLLAFIVLGMVFGSEGIFRIPFDDFQFAETICSVALIFIMFYGGFGTRWKAARPIAGKAILLSSAGTILTALLTGLFCHFVLGFSLLEGLLTGAVLGSTDAASVFSVLRSQKLSLKYNTDSLLEVESGSNDPFAYMLMVIILSAMQNGSGGNLPLQIFSTAFSQVIFGIIPGLAIALAARWFLDNFTFETNGFDAAFMLATAVLAYALPSSIGGNGYLSTYLVGIILGNHSIRNKKSLVNFFDGLTSLMQMLIFFILGLLSFPSRIAAVWIPALGIAFFLTLIARPLVIALLMTPMKAPFHQQLLVSWAGLRGAASIVFAIMAVMGGVTLEHDLFHIVFCIVLLSISIQGTLLPWCARKTKMINESGNVLTTFNDYTDEIDVQFISISITGNHPWAGKTVRELDLPPGSLLVFLRRGGKNFVPKGDTVIEEGDALVLSASAYTGEDDIHLREIPINQFHDWCGKTVKDLVLPKNSLIILIRRGEESIIPSGQTQILPGDLIVLNTV